MAVRPSPEPAASVQPSAVTYGVRTAAPTSLSVNGVSLHMDRADVERWLGAGQVVAGNLDRGFGEVRYDRYRVRVTLGRNQVLAVAGTKLRFDDRVVLVVGDSRARAIEALGRCSSLPGRPDVLYDMDSHAVVYLRDGVVSSIEIFSRC